MDEGIYCKCLPLFLLDTRRSNASMKLRSVQTWIGVAFLEEIRNVKEYSQLNI